MRPDRGGRLRPDPRPDPLQARDGGRLPCTDRGEHDRRAAAAGPGRPARARDARAHDGRALGIHRTTYAICDRKSAARDLQRRGHRRRGRVHRRARAARGPDRDQRRRRRLRPRRLRSAAARACELHLRADVLCLRVRAEVPRRPRPAGERRLLPARHARRSARQRHELHLAEPRRRRLGDADPARRRDLPRPPARPPGAASGGHEGDDVPRGLRRRRPADERLLLLPRDLRRRLRRTLRERRPRCRAGARAEHRERTGRGDGAELPGARDAALARRGLRRAGALPGRPRAAQGLPLRPADDVHRARRPDAARACRRLRRRGGRCRRVRADPGRAGEPAVGEGRRSSSWRATRSATAPAAAAATGRPPSAIASSSRATCARARSAASGPRRSTDGGRRPDHLRGDPERARGGDRRDGAGAEAQRLLDEHQDALRLLLRLLRRTAAAGRAGLRAARPPRLDGGAGAEGGRALWRGAARAGRRARHQRPASERRPPERRLADLARPRRGRPDRVRREPRAPRRRRRRRARVDRRLPRGLPGGRDHPAGEAGLGRADRARRLPADPRADPLEARDGRRLPGADRRQRDRRPPRAGAGRAPRARDDPRDDGRAARVHRAAHALRARAAAARRLRGRGLRRQRRLHRRAGAAARTHRARRRTASASTPPAPTSSGARRSTRPGR